MIHMLQFLTSLGYPKKYIGFSFKKFSLIPFQFMRFLMLVFSLKISWDHFQFFCFLAELLLLAFRGDSVGACDTTESKLRGACNNAESKLCGACDTVELFYSLIQPTSNSYRLKINI